MLNIVLQLDCCVEDGCRSCRFCYSTLDKRLLQAARYTGGAGLLFGFLEVSLNIKGQSIPGGSTRRGRGAFVHQLEPMPPLSPS